MSENFKLPKCWTSEVLHPNCLISNCPIFQTVHIFCLLEDPPVCHTCFWYLQIFSGVLPWLIFEYWITCQLCRFRCKSATVYVLLHLSNVFCGLVFLLTLLNFSLTEFLWVFFWCIFPLDLRKKYTGKKVLIVMMVQNLWAFLFLSNLLKLWRHFTKNTDVIAKIVLRNKFWYGTVY